MNHMFLILLGTVSYVTLVSTSCRDFKTCATCIGYASERCIWCAQDVMNSNQPGRLNARCQNRRDIKRADQLEEDWCPLHLINDPVSKNPEVIGIQKPFNAKAGEEIQFLPQKMQLTLRPGIPVQFDMFYQPAKDYPLDMYFLMDSSYTMKKYAEQLSDQTMKIYVALKELTNNVQLGIGSFVDKPSFPYADPNIHKTCNAFKHHLSMTNDTDLFKKILKSYHQTTDANYDSPEAGLDALMQIMKCGKKIGWRSSATTGVQARRIIILATDATYHSAGDGKMVGAYKPNDMECHLDENNTYDIKTSLTLDYPSVSQINYVAKENNVVIVFAVLNEVIEPYEALAKQIFGAECTKLESDQIITIIKDAYVNASSHVKLYTDSPKSIKIETSCDKSGQCKSTKAKPIVNIKATVTALDCISDTEMTINPFGISDKLSIKIKVDCKCPCEDNAIRNSTDCSLHGDKLCGICKCNKDRSGDKCETECNENTAKEMMSQCRNDTNDISNCNDHGDCVCGKCLCHNKNGTSFSGNFCQFNDASCRVKCLADKGDCHLGVCICKDPTQWRGEFCNCPVSDKRCIGPFSAEPCSGRGTCDCGQCKCKSINGKEYFGNYCESCKDCSKELCEQLKDYAHCNYENNTKADCDARFNQTSVKEVKIMNRTALEADTTATGCRKKLSNGDTIVYKYKIIDGSETETAQLELMIQDEMESPPVANIWIAIGSVVGGMFLIGLVTLLIWKIATDIHDKREFEKFCQEATTAGFDVSNPVYQDPNATFVNPAYNGDSCPAY